MYREQNLREKKKQATNPTGLEFELLADETLPFDRGRYTSIAVIKMRQLLVEQRERKAARLEGGGFKWSRKSE